MKTLLRIALIIFFLSIAGLLVHSISGSEAQAAPVGGVDPVAVSPVFHTDLMDSMVSPMLQPVLPDDEVVPIAPLEPGMGGGSEPTVIDSGTEYGPCENGQRTVTHWSKYSDGTAASSIWLEPCDIIEPVPIEPACDGPIICVDGVNADGTHWGYCYCSDCDKPDHDPNLDCPIPTEPDCDDDPDGPGCPHEGSENPGTGNPGGGDNGGSDSGTNGSGTPVQPQPEVSHSKLPNTGVNGVALLFIVSFSMTGLVIACSIRMLAVAGKEQR